MDTRARVRTPDLLDTVVLGTDPGRMSFDRCPGQHGRGRTKDSEYLLQLKEK